MVFAFLYSLILDVQIVDLYLQFVFIVLLHIIHLDLQVRVLVLQDVQFFFDLVLFLPQPIINMRFKLSTFVRILRSLSGIAYRPFTFHRSTSFPTFAFRLRIDF